MKSTTQKFTAMPVFIKFKYPNFNGATVVNQLRHNGFDANMIKFNAKERATDFYYISLHERFNLTLKDHRLTKTRGAHTEVLQATLKAVIDQTLAANTSPVVPELPPFIGGFLGYFGYDYARYANPVLPQHPKDPYALNDADLSFVDQILTFDHHQQTAYLIQLVSTETYNTQKVGIIQQLEQLKTQLLTMPQIPAPTFKLTQPFQMYFDHDSFEKRVNLAKQHVYDGDIFQLILANQQHAKMAGSLLGIGKDFFKKNPTPYQFYYKHGNYEAIGASPETLVTKLGDTLFTYPLAGTRRRGHTEAEEAKFMHELRTDPKEISEHNMLVDLGRNDLGRVSAFGTVKVTHLRELLKFAQVMHIGSTIESQVDPSKSSMDIVAALMPAGTLSGAPKMKAMSLINELEDQKRGLYGGCLGYLSTTGDLDLCIGIRLAYRKGDDLFVHSGAGIVADSEPDKEYLEFNNKARAIMLALDPQTTGGKTYVNNRG
ncbi:MAG: anthranilate synthase component I family protein [Lactobacillus sp.]|jgi:anthranilate synthase component 1|nr:anthranilate synthase component I family protein [Lactobacillus sp.]